MRNISYGESMYLMTGLIIGFIVGVIVVTTVYMFLKKIISLTKNRL